MLFGQDTSRVVQAKVNKHELKLLSDPLFMQPEINFTSCLITASAKPYRLDLPHNMPYNPHCGVINKKYCCHTVSVIAEQTEIISKHISLNCPLSFVHWKV